MWEFVENLHAKGIRLTKISKHSHRELELLEALHRLGGSARSAELAKTLDVSEETVRRTIKALAKSGVLERMYGGAHLAGPRGASGFMQRIATHPVEKRAIAGAVAAHVYDGMTLFLDVGSTTAFVAQALRARSLLTVVTNSIGVAEILASHNGNQVHLLGGEMQSDERGTFGAMTQAQVARFAYDLAILSTDALSPRQGFLCLNAAEAALAGAVAGNAARVLVALDHHKFNRTAPHCSVPADRVDEIVTDAMPSGVLAQALTVWGIDIHLANGVTHDI